MSMVASTDIEERLSTIKHAGLTAVPAGFDKRGRPCPTCSRVGSTSPGESRPGVVPKEFCRHVGRHDDTRSAAKTAARNWNSAALVHAYRGDWRDTFVSELVADRPAPA